MAEPADRVPRWLDVGASYAWRVLLVAGAIYLAVIALARLRVVVMPLVIALFLSTVLVPPAQWLRRHGWPPLAATWAVFVAGMLVVAAVLLYIVPSVTHHFGALQHEANKGIKRIQDWMVRGPLHMSRKQVKRDFHNLGKEIQKNRTKLLEGALQQATIVLDLVVGGILSIVFAFFFVKDGSVITNWWLGVFDEEHAADLRAIGDRVWRTVSGYIRGTAINGVVNGTLMFIALVAIGVPLAGPIAVLTFVGGFFPIVGALLTGALAALLALVAKGPLAAVLVIGVTIVIHNVEGYLVGPVVLGRAVKLHTIVVLIALAAGGAIGGIPGAFVAVPLTAVVLTVIDYYRLKRRPSDDADASAAEPPPPRALRGRPPIG
ncbi:MAG TPA: AI-2E family transporter [Acidimicrobiia bacterium]|nr:AI-2E family transporter [Acidimicrobiia bacterium]